MLGIRQMEDQTFYQGTSREDYAEEYTVRVGDMIYSGWCSEEHVWQHCDINFVINAPVQVRVDKSHLYLLRSNGKEQRITIDQRKISGPTEK